MTGCNCFAGRHLPFGRQLPTVRHDRPFVRFTASFSQIALQAETYSTVLWDNMCFSQYAHMQCIMQAHRIAQRTAQQQLAVYAAQSNGSSNGRSSPYVSNPYAEELRATAKSISNRGRGILASDESNVTTGKRLASVGRPA